eukprot:7292137-Prymnesium_polylepis.1
MVRVYSVKPPVGETAPFLAEAFFVGRNDPGGCRGIRAVVATGLFLRVDDPPFHRKLPGHVKFGRFRREPSFRNKRIVLSAID